MDDSQTRPRYSRASAHLSHSAAAALGYSSEALTAGNVIFLFAWWRVILQGVLQILWCNVVVNRGEFVVGCVVKRGELTTTFPESKMCHYFDLFFVYFSLLILLLRFTKLSHNSEILPRTLRHDLGLAFGHGLRVHQVGTDAESEGSGLQKLLCRRQRNPTRWNQIDLGKRPLECGQILCAAHCAGRKHLHHIGSGLPRSHNLCR